MNLHYRRIHAMYGVELGYSYAGLPMIATEPGDPQEWDTSTYTPHTRPGVRLPHVWLNDGRAMQDILRADYTWLMRSGNWTRIRSFEFARASSG